MTPTHLRRIRPQAAVRPSMPDSARGFGPLSASQAQPGVVAVLRRRMHYCIRFLRFLAIHRNIKSVRWVLACEGTTW